MLDEIIKVHRKRMNGYLPNGEVSIALLISFKPYNPLIIIAGQL